jgi:FkbM family methyltransferase
MPQTLANRSALQSTKILPFTVWFRQSEEFHIIKREIFTQNAYYIEFESEQPVIIDAGAHIGLATLYFKKLYPNSKIWAIEPIKENFEILQMNVETNRLPDVHLFEAALSETGSETTLYFDATETAWLSTAGKEPGAWNHQQTSRSKTVPAMQLSQLISQINLPVDLLKLDIEGAELSVLKEAQSHLGKVKHIIMEYHPIKTQSLRQIVTLLENQGFLCEIWKDGKAISEQKSSGLVYIQASRK